MSESNEPDRDRLAALFGADKLSQEPLPQSDREWVAEQLEPVAGDRILASLSEAQITAFVEYTMLDLELEEIQQLLRNRLEQYQIKAMRAPTTWNEHVQRAQEFSLYQDAAEAEEAWRVYATAEHLKNAFWFGIRQVHDAWGDLLAIRHGFVVVTAGKKYKL